MLMKRRIRNAYNDLLNRPDILHPHSLIFISLFLSARILSSSSFLDRINPFRLPFHRPCDSL